MKLAEDYAQQDNWRNWPRFLPFLQLSAGMRILDLGCSIGTMAGLLAARGAQVTAIERQPELLTWARGRQLPGVTLLEGDLTRLGELGLPFASFDGLWCSYVAAYFPHLQKNLMDWMRWLRPGGWIALLEVDDLLAHTPVSAAHGGLLESFVSQAADYDFRMGRKLAGHLASAGFGQIVVSQVEDDELTASGPLPAAILAGWQRRLARMQGLQHFCGEAFPAVQADFLQALASPLHRSACRVMLAQAIAP